MITQQDERDLIGFAIIGNLFKDEKMLGALSDTIRRLGCVNVLTWLSKQSPHPKFYALLLTACATVVREDDLSFGEA